MDPQATLNEILNIADNHLPRTSKEDERYQELFSALYRWLKNGGFPPICTTLRQSPVQNMDGSSTIKPRKWLGDIEGWYAIMSTDSNAETPTEFKFVKYTFGGMQEQEWILPFTCSY